MRRMIILPLVVVLNMVFLFQGLVLGQERFGPKPFLTPSHDPFTSGPFSRVEIEDFEGGSLNPFFTIEGDASPLGPTPLTDAAVGQWALLIHEETIVIRFDAPVTHFSVVVTDVGRVNGAPTGRSSFRIEGLNTSGRILVTHSIAIFGDERVDGGKEEDRVVGVSYLRGINAVRVSMTDSDDWEIDHLRGARKASICPNVPPACRVGTGRVEMRDKDFLTFRWNGNGNFPSPLRDRVYELCLYEGEQLVLGAQAVGQWEKINRRFVFLDTPPRGDSEKIRSMILRPIGVNVKVIGRDSEFLPISGSLTVQLHETAGRCWETGFEPPFTRNSRLRFLDTSE